jgi:hypothetical protein
VNPTEAKTYVGIGGSQVYQYRTDDRQCCNQQAEIFGANTTTARNSGISIAYDPSSAVFTLQVRDANSGASTNTRFQDPASRTDFGGALEPQWGTPELANANIAYLQAGDGNPLSPYRSSGSGAIYPGDNANQPSGVPESSYQATSLFYLKPGTETRYVTFAGFARNDLGFTEGDVGGVPTEINTYKLERGAFAFGEVTANSAVPTTGSGSYIGSMLASMVYNPTIDGQDPSGLTDLPTFFQWIEGSSNLSVNFANNTFELVLNGTTFGPQYDTWTNRQVVLDAGATFAAQGRGTINMINFGGFKGAFESASLAAVGGGTRNVTIAGSSIDGTFYGPAAQEAGGGFHIVGGNPDERIDILGAFVGKK